MVRDALPPYKDSVIEPLWNVALDPQRNAQERFQAACALATYAPDDPRWGQINTFVAGRLVSLEASTLVAWREALRPAKGQLIKPLALIYRDTNQKEQARIYATETLADYAADRPNDLFDLLADAELFQFPVLFGKLALYKEQAVALAQQGTCQTAAGKGRPRPRRKLWRSDRPTPPSLCSGWAAQTRSGRLSSSRPTRGSAATSFIGSVHWEGDPQPIVQRLDSEPDVTIRRALVLSLGGFTESQLSIAQRQPLIEKLLADLRERAGRGAARGGRMVAAKMGSSETPGRSGREAQERRKAVAEPKVERQAAVVRQHAEADVRDRRCRRVSDGIARIRTGVLDSSQLGHRCRIGRRFAISAHEVTKAQFRAFEQTVKGVYLANHPGLRQVVRTDDSPQTALTWYEAAHYCDWLSEQENIPRDQWCYDPKGGAYVAGMKAKEKFWELTRLSPAHGGGMGICLSSGER